MFEEDFFESADRGCPMCIARRTRVGKESGKESRVAGSSECGRDGGGRIFESSC